MSRDCPGAPDNMHDFDLVGDEVIAVEVTRAARDPDISMWTAINKRTWHAPTLHRRWTISVVQPSETAAPRIKKLHREAEKLLAVLENSGVGEFESRSPERRVGDQALDAIAGLARLGVVRGREIGPPGAGEVPHIYVGSSGGFTTSPEAINARASMEIQGNITKLRAANADQRHLFIWVHSTAHEVELALHQNHPPGPLQMPEGLDTVWLARPGFHGYDAPLYRLWRAERGRGWEILVTGSLLADG